MKNQKPTVALIYDFDGTLSPGNMQEFGFIQALNNNKEAFWEECCRLSNDNDADGVLCYMLLMLQKARAGNISLTRESFRKFGSNIPLYHGVSGWFEMINREGQERGLIIEHYINSSGLTEMIEGTPIAMEFRKIYACSYLYDESGEAFWPGVAVNYTTKTQFLFKINKGIDSIGDNKIVNEFLEDNKRKIPFSRMIYFGDGETDIPCMKLVKQEGGHSIGVYKPGDIKKLVTAEKLIADGRVNFVCPADYGKGSEIHRVVLAILDRISAGHDSASLLNNQRANPEMK